MKVKDEPGYPIAEGIKMDRETLQSYMPKGYSGKITDEVLEMINNVETDTGMSNELFSEQLCSYTHLLSGGASIEKLSNAIKYCNLRLVPNMGSAKAYRIVFPAKAAEVEARGQTVDSFASMYSQTKLVVEIQKLLLVPTYVGFAPVRHAMIKKLFDLSNGIGAKGDDRVSPTVQMNSAVALMEATKMPEESNVELKIGMSDEAKSVTQGLMEQLSLATELQMQRMNKGESIIDVQAIGITRQED